MIEEDTVKLLRECNAGIKMGADSIEEVLPRVKNSAMRQTLSDCLEEHQRLGSQTHALLNRYGDAGKDVNPVAKAMSWMKTEAMLAADKSDHTIADLMTDGCNMGVKSLSRYLNQYAAADEHSKDVAKKLIALEAKLSEDLRDHL